ncbi:type VI secretion system contractile sheath large subunit [Niveispirillum sp. KHB5.9]|uniref:type VI secretion system contractile sheath large subunit n=1 Tax=Niveispirillum sp. KHB5.9 TaxID=3400269 RepID=UPI003A8A5A72
MEHVEQTVKSVIATKQTDMFAEMLREEVKFSDTRRKSDMDETLQVLAERAMAGTQTQASNVFDRIRTMIADIDARLSSQVNEIIHHPEFQSMERAWRGLHYLVANTQSDEHLKIKVFNASKAELNKALAKYSGDAFVEGTIFKKIYLEEFAQLGGHPYSCIIGDYYFDHSAQDVETLREMSSVAAAAHAPFIAAAAPSVLRMNSWQEIGNPSSIRGAFTGVEYTAWRSLREKEDSRYLGLTMPRFLVRAPYGSKGKPVEGFAFEEEIPNGRHEYFCWANAAYAMGTNITRSFKKHGWISQIRGSKSGGLIENLPAYTYETDDGRLDLKCPTEAVIHDLREPELAESGFMALVHEKHTDQAVFLGAQSLQKPAVYDDPAATANANLAARLPYLFATCRFAHYLKALVRDHVGSFTTSVALKEWLERWINNYVDGDPANSTDEVKARKPLAEARVSVADVPGNPGYYTAEFHLRPHYQLEGLTAALKLVAEMRGDKGK